jgi:osmotically-inducible protein OsmY
MSKRYEDRYGRVGYRRDRDYADDRGYMDRAGDEVRSWFGDEDAERRREQDEQRDSARDRQYGSGWPRSDWSWANRDRMDRERTSYRDTGRDWRERESQQDWRTDSARDPLRDSDYERRASNTDRGRGWAGDTSRYRDSDRYTLGTYRPATSWSTDDRRAQIGEQWGRGPKGYRRSDNRILEDVCDRLTYSDVDAGDIEVRVENGEVTLSGSVHNRWDKRRAEDVAEDVAGVHEVHNNIRVHRDDRGLGQSETSISNQPGTVLGVNPTAGSTLANERPKAKS